jgi:hypothetical protein
MRKRNNSILLRLNDEEYKHFQRELKISGLSKNQYLVRLINNHEIKERPPQDYAKIVYELAKIGNAVNEITRKANETNGVSADDVQRAVMLMKTCWKLVEGLG